MLGRFLKGGRRRGPPARDARLWSNREIRKLGAGVTGSVVNVSAWKDEDKEGGHYHDYFPNAAAYATTNYSGWRGDEGATDHDLDLRAPPPAELAGAFDLVFNHTTLEHVFDLQRAFATLCDLSRDAVLIVVPFMQHLHGPEDGDFWRISPYAMRRMLETQGLAVLYESAGPAGGAIRYTVHFASRRPGGWDGRLPATPGDAAAVLRERLPP